MPSYQHHFHAMGGRNEIQVCAASEQQALRACMVGQAEVARIEVKYSRYKKKSELSRIHAGIRGISIKIDAETASLLAYADACYQASGGLFDITSGVLRKAWDFSVQGSGQAIAARLPTAAQLEPLLALVGWSRVQWSADHITLPAGMQLDFGGIGKEYAADRAASVMAAMGVQHALVNLGGDVRILGPQALPASAWDGWQAQATQPWYVGIAHPRKPDAVACTLAMERGALATSGDYERFLEIDGQRYGHILHPATGMPVAYWQSVSVAGPLCTGAGSASTIAMLLGEQAQGFLEAQSLDYLALRDGWRVAQGVFAQRQGVTIQTPAQP